MTTVSLKNSKADRSDDTAERSGAGGIGQRWQEQYAPVQGEPEPGADPRLGCSCASAEPKEIDAFKKTAATMSAMHGLRSRSSNISSGERPIAMLFTIIPGPSERKRISSRLLQLHVPCPGGVSA